MKRSFLTIVAALAAVGLMIFPALAANPAANGKTEEFLSQAAEQQKYAFIVFHKEDNPSLKAMAQTLKGGLAPLKDRAAVRFVVVTDPSERAVVKQFGVDRAPLPLAVAVAPNGAITGVFPRKLTEADIAGSFVTPAMAHCMKTMQDGRLVLVCVHGSPNATLPVAVKDFRSDPQFKDRVSVFSIQATDPAEAQFLEQMEIDPDSADGSTTVFLAPPGVLIGKFDTSATKAQLAAALHKAGKCCDDPKCKHNKGARGSQSSPKRVRQANQAPSAKRN